MNRKVPLILYDEDIRKSVSVKEAIEVIRDAFLDKHNGRVTQPLRSGINMGDTSLVWTPGGFPDENIMGLRLYLTGLQESDQLVSVWDTATGRIECLSIGNYLGILRTAAIGGAAIDLLSRKDSKVLGIIGFGKQGIMQAKAACAVRNIERIHAYRRNSVELAKDTRKLSVELGIDVEPVDAPEEAVKKADIVVTATGSGSPVIRREWIKPGTHINSLGPKYQGNTELDPSMILGSDLVCSDFPEKYREESEFILHGTQKIDALRDLADLICSGYTRTAEEITLFLSHGFPGTEVKLLDYICKK